MSLFIHSSGQETKGTKADKQMNTISSMVAREIQGKILNMIYHQSKRLDTMAKYEEVEKCLYR